MPPPPPPPPDEELELLEVLDPPPPPPEDDDDELELDGALEDELEEEVLEVLGAAELDEDVLDVEEAVGDVGPPFSQPMEATRPMVIAPPLSRRRKSRRAARAFCASFSSIFRSFGWAMPSALQARSHPSAVDSKGHLTPERSGSRTAVRNPEMFAAAAQNNRLTRSSSRSTLPRRSSRPAGL